MPHNFKKKSNQVCAWLLTGVNENKNERLFSETITFRNRLKGTLFYGNIALLISNQDSVIKILFIVKRRK